MKARDSGSLTSLGTCATCGANLLEGDRFCGGCGAPIPDAAEADLLADLQHVTLGDYEIKGVLGHGGMGVVYLAHDLSLGKNVAIKVLPPTLFHGEAAVQRFRREARIAASLRHRHITSVFALKETTRLLFFVMEYVEGRTLDAILRDEGRLPVNVASAIVHDALSALAYAHRREVVHRDLKPGNIIIDIEGMSMITDFGVAKLSTAEGLTTTGSTVGSPKYMSPEQWSGKATYPADQYALGCVAYQLLAGHAPFEGESLEELMKQQLFDAPQPLAELVPDCPEVMAAAVMRMLDKDAAKRWPSLEEALDAMELRPLSPRDPARVQLADWAKRGHDVRALPKTPQSPIRISKTPPRKVDHAATPPRVAVKRDGPGAIARAAAAMRALAVRGAAAVRAGAVSAGRALRRGVAQGAPLVGAAGRALRRPVALAVLSGIAAVVVVVLIVSKLGSGREGELTLPTVPKELAVGDRFSLPQRAIGTGTAADSMTLLWSSSDTAVAEVSRDGVIEARSAGSVVLTARAGGRRARVEITVRPSGAASIVISPRRRNVMMDSSAQLAAVVRGRDGTELSDRVVQWTVDRNEIAFVSDHGVVTGLSPGRATVTATVEGVTDQVTVTVRRGRETVANRTTGVVIEPVKPRLRVGETFQVRALVNGAERPAVWRSADSNIAAISSTGLITGVSQSVTTITATIGSTVSRASLVIVDPKPVAIVAPLAPPPAPPTAPISETTPAAGTTFLLDQSSYTIEIGDSIRLHAFIRQGWERTERGATWSSSDSSVVAVGSQSGWARGVSLGSAVVTAVAEDRRSVAAPVKVSPRGTANGVLKLRVGPGKGDITVDNVHHGLYSRFDVPLTPYVKHVITIARTGYVTVDTTITLRSGQERIIAITLKRAQP